jgi:hypothetical protein
MYVYKIKLFMIDFEKTNSLRDKLNPIKTNKVDDDSKAKATGGFYFIFIFLLKLLFFHLSQDIILEKMNIIPMLWWQSGIVYFGTVSFVSIFKK